MAAATLTVSSAATRAVELDSPAPLGLEAAAAHGSAMLDALGRLQTHELGAAANATASLQHLAGFAAGASRAADPGMQAILDAIGARVAVELERRRTPADT